MTLLSTVLAFDLGASSGRALIGQLFDDNGQAKLQVKEIHRFPNHAIQVGHHLHWDILRLLREIKSGIRKAFQEGYAPETFGIDTWGVDFGLLDGNGELIGNPYHYRDSQTEGLIEEIEELIGKDALYEQGGLQFMPFNTIYQLFAMKKVASPKLNIAHTLLLTPDLLMYFLTGKKVCEFTMATTTQLFLPEQRAWNYELMMQLGIPTHLFLDPIQPGQFVGPLTPQVCEEIDVPPIIAVAVGTHDTESAIAAVPAVKDQFAYLVCGTWSLLGTERQHPLLTLEAMALDFSNEGGVGGTYQLLKNIMGLWILQECKREWEEQGNEITYSELVAGAQHVGAFRSLIDPDHSRFYSPNGMVKKIQNFCRETGQQVPESEGEVTRCILESLSFRYRHAVEQMENLTGHRFNGLHMVGGGIQNELLSQFTANALGRSVWAGPVEASAIGNMLMQLVALGRFNNLQEARKMVAQSFPLSTYSPSETEQWDLAYKAFKQLIGKK
ncbi:MAG: rhamnulokinase family protein [Paenibacillaceae bacterium]